MLLELYLVEGLIWMGKVAPFAYSGYALLFSALRLAAL